MMNSFVMSLSVQNFGAYAISKLSGLSAFDLGIIAVLFVSVVYIVYRRIKVAEEKKIDACCEDANCEQDLEKLENGADGAEAQDKIQNEDLIKEFEYKYARLSADFSNYKKRVEKEKADIYKYANEKLILSLLPALDDYERAITHVGENTDTAFVEGMGLVFKKVLDSLKAQGLSEIDALGAPFNPDFHNAVVMEENENYEADTVCEVLVKGYTLDGKVIRHSLVKVAN